VWVPHPLIFKGAGVAILCGRAKGGAVEFDFAFALSSLMVRPIFQFELLGADVSAHNRRMSRLQFYLQ
jgi:hypothetical protein